MAETEDVLESSDVQSTEYSVQDANYTKHSLSEFIRTVVPATHKNEIEI